LDHTSLRVRNSPKKLNKPPLDEAPVLLWGRGADAKALNVDHRLVINPYLLSDVVTNKRKFAAANFSDSIEWTEDKEVALQWAGERREKVVCRTTLNGHSGQGIVIARNPEQVVDAPLYSRYFRKVREFRAYMAATRHHLGDYDPEEHIKVMYLASKRNAGGVEKRDDLLVRSKTKGWVFQREDVEDATVGQLGDTCHGFMSEFMDHVNDWDHAWIMALDIAQNKDGVCKILEANLAPGLNEHTAKAVEEGCEYLRRVHDE